MPRTFDRKKPVNDKDPTRNELDWDNPGGMIAEGAEQAGDLIHRLFSGFGKMFNLPTPEEFLSSIASGVGTVINGATDFIDGVGNFFGKLIGGFLDPFQVPILDRSKILNLPDLFDDVVAGFKGAFDGWFGGSSGAGTVAEFTYTFESIKDAVINGFTVTTFTSDTAAWSVPMHAEMTAVMISGGMNGSSVTGGAHGSFLATPIDLTGITSLDIQIGTAGNLSYVREAHGTPHTGAIVAQSATQGSAGGIAGSFGLTASSSQPGSGGNGSPTSSTSGLPGEPSALAAGGTGGASGTFGQPGTAGGAVSAGSQIKCGGGGGGGGGGATFAGNFSGAGGAGGYPGGGGGGRGTVAGGGFPGAVGPGAPGVVWLFYR